MRKLSILALVTVVLAMASCQKSSVAPSDSANGTLTSDATTKKTNFQLLTARTWEYAKYYINYVDSTHPGTLVYRRGGIHNTLNLDFNRVTFNTDGTVNEIDENGNSVPGTWYFTNEQQTSYVVSNSYGNHYTDINYLSNRRFEWTGPYVHTHAIMISAN